MLSNTKIIEIFCAIDNFFQDFVLFYQQKGCC